MKTKEEMIEHNFKYHTVNKVQAENITELRLKAKELAYMIDEVCPNTRERALAMTKLEETTFWANASISRKE